MEQMEFEVAPSRVADVSVVRLNGPFTLSTMFDLQAALRDPGLKGLIIDLEGVPYMDSAGLGVVLAQFAHTQRRGSKFAVANVSPRVLTIFELTHTDKVLPMFATLEAAEKSLGA